jgi:sugar lactone lactonase YvrE
LVAVAPAEARQKWNTRIFARIGDPGYPALSLVAPDRTVYVGTFTDAAGSDTGPSKVFAYRPTGKLKRTFVIKGQTPGAAHGVQVAAMDARGVLYLLDQNPSRVLKLNPRTGKQQTFATFHDVPPCTAATQPNGDCSDTVADNTPEPDYAAWGPDRSLYVTDYTQAVLWRVPPGGGRAHVWFTDPQIDGTNFGPAGIVLMPDHRTLMFDTSGGGVTTPGDPLTGQLYTLGIEPNGTPGTLKQIWESGPKEAPDGFALAKSGNVYMALVGPQTNQLVEISRSGQELARFPLDTSGANGTSIPFDEPSSVQFDGRRMLVTNDAFFSGDPSHFAVFDIWAGEPGAKVFIPGFPRPTYRLTVHPKRVTRGTHVFHFHATRNKKPVRGVLIRFAGRRARTGKHGNAVITATLCHAGSHTARLTPGSKRGAPTVSATKVKVVGGSCN